MDPNVFWGPAITTTKHKYHYDAALTPVVTSVEPTMSSTAGGATVTIKGDNFGKNPIVTLGGQVCAYRREDVGSYPDENGKPKNLCDWGAELNAKGGNEDGVAVDCDAMSLKSNEIVCITNPIAVWGEG